MNELQGVQTLFNKLENNKVRKEKYECNSSRDEKTLNYKIPRLCWKDNF